MTSKTGYRAETELQYNDGIGLICKQQLKY